MVDVLPSTTKTQLFRALGEAVVRNWSRLPQEVQHEGYRVGRNPKTGEKAPIPARRVMVFKPSAILKQNIQRKTASVDGGLSTPAQAEQSAAQSR
jgi:hypothetical protein